MNSKLLPPTALFGLIEVSFKHACDLALPKEGDRHVIYIQHCTLHDDGYTWTLRTCQLKPGGEVNRLEEYARVDTLREQVLPIEEKTAVPFGQFDDGTVSGV